jgi:isocitrate dehydrogenase
LLRSLCGTWRGCIGQANAEKIERDFLQCQGAPVDIDGYYWPDRTKLREAMCPSATFNAILAEMSTSS